VNIAERVEPLRIERGWTKAEVARRTGLHYMHVHKVLAGLKPRVEGETVKRLARAFGVTTDYLLGMDIDDSG